MKLYNGNFNYFYTILISYDKILELDPYYSECTWNSKIQLLNYL